jgi:hypothetical protein
MGKVDDFQYPEHNQKAHGDSEQDSGCRRHVEQ